MVQVVLRSRSEVYKSDRMDGLSSSLYNHISTLYLIYNSSYIYLQQFLHYATDIQDGFQVRTMLIPRTPPLDISPLSFHRPWIMIKARRQTVLAGWSSEI